MDTMHKDALSEISDLIRNVNYEDKSLDVAIFISEIIVKGKPVDYIFKLDPELRGRGYWAGDTIQTLRLDELIKSLLGRSGLIKIEERPNGTLIRPTNKALKLYEQFRQEGKLDAYGFLYGKGWMN